jgi:hypothetical protein
MTPRVRAALDSTVVAAPAERGGSPRALGPGVVERLGALTDGVLAVAKRTHRIGLSGQIGDRRGPGSVLMSGAVVGSDSISFWPSALICALSAVGWMALARCPRVDPRRASTARGRGARGSGFAMQESSNGVRNEKTWRIRPGDRN